MGTLIVIVVVVVLVVAVGLLVVTGLNRLRTQRVSVDEAMAGIDVQLSRRADLIPNLVETVKGYMGHERQTLEAVTQARADAQRATSVSEKSAADGEMRAALALAIAPSKERVIAPVWNRVPVPVQTIHGTSGTSTPCAS